MNNTIIKFMMNNWLIPLIIVGLVIVVVAKKTNFSLTDYLADRVIQKMEANYQPYGPTATHDR